MWSFRWNRNVCCLVVIYRHVRDCNVAYLLQRHDDEGRKSQRRPLNLFDQVRSADEQTCAF
jgi:hypothetical protein